ncbi:hypothetical protein KBC04_02925 [Candidatus Babeliales bacterium]|nr:hypothetical protein [Candidatus Babeliales bacterium]MBP9843994.1 hypothetical protein [Candidatus Babeliales bacterium]
MVNNNTKAPKEQKEKRAKITSYAEHRAAAHDDLIAEEIDLNHQKISAGFENVSWEQLNEKSVEELPQAQGAELIELLKSRQSYLDRKLSFDCTIYVEPSKLHENVDAIEVLLLRNDNQIYQRSGKLVRITQISNSPHSKNKFIKRAADSIIIKEIDQAYLTVLLTKVGTFLAFDGRAGNFKKMDCPERMARYFIAKQEWKTPILTGITSTPTLRADGTILDNPGYDPLSGLLFIPGDYLFEKIPNQPNLQDAIRAKNTLLELIKDFPFEDEASKSVVIAAILTALIRKSIPTAPLFGFTAPKMASGKSLLADLISLISTGKANSVISQCETEVEEKKRILSLLMEGDPIICYDNIEKPFKSAALCSILTQAEYKDRILGSSETRTVLTNATFLATGNNLTFMGDITTRVLLCKLDAQVEHPEERSFETQDLRKYVLEHRAELVIAGLTIVRAYFVAGKPKQNIKPFGRFEAWSDIIRSAIVWVGMADPCESRKEIEQSDPIRMVLASLFFSWYEIFESRPIKIKELIDQVSHHIDSDAKEALRDALIELAADHKDGINQRSLAKKFALYKNRIEQGFKLEQSGINQGTSLWRIRKI